MDIAKERGIAVIEDPAEAIGSEYNGEMIGSIDDLCCFGFFPTENLGCFGDGSMIITKSEDLASKLRILRVHGSNAKYYHAELGYNSRRDTLQAAILDVNGLDEDAR